MPWSLATRTSFKTSNKHGSCLGFVFLNSFYVTNHRKKKKLSNLILMFYCIRVTSDCLGADSRSPGSTRGKWPRQRPTFFILYSQPKALHPQPSPYPQSSEKKNSLPRPPRCVIVTHKVYTYAGLFIRQILINRLSHWKLFSSKLQNSLKML
jgi:hypothetical protein